MDFSKLPNPVAWAIPAFVVLMLAELFVGRFLHSTRYEVKDTMASLMMGLGNIVIGLVAGLLIGAVTVALYQVRLFDLGLQWWVFVLIFFAEDFCYYWMHRLSHERRWLWASHIVHHSSQHYNLSTALRQTWTSLLSGGWLLWLPLALLGFHPLLIAFQQGVSLVYQFWIHTEAIDRLGPLEWVFNTPSHHRVHHATNPRYLDKNYAGILIIWDRMFETFEEEDPEEPPEYGIISPLATFNPFKIATHEWVSILKDIRQPLSFKERLMYMFGPPGWSHDGSRQTVEDMQREHREKQAASSFSPP
jgi:sterol desaturase/sphingolipid hydroxylase (fatty acid hydroxylase superfamily)